MPVSEINEPLERLEQSAQHLSGLMAGLPCKASGKASIHIEAGGVGMWIASVCCIIMLVVGLTLSILGGEAIMAQNQRMAAQHVQDALWMQHTDAQMARMQDYLNAIYMQAPQLRPGASHGQLTRHQPADHNHHHTARQER